MSTELTDLELVEEAVMNRQNGDYDWSPAEAALGRLKEHPRLNPSEHRNWRKAILQQVRVMRVQPRDVLVWRLPVDVLNDEDEMAKARAIASEFAVVCRMPILILEEGTDLTAEHLPAELRRQAPVIHLPPGLTKMP